MKSDRSDYTDNLNNSQDSRNLVRQGYNAIARRYLAARESEPANVGPVHKLMTRLAPGALVLDAGCGAGIPVTRLLQQRYRVVGVDFSPAQLSLARSLVPDAPFVCQDLTALGFRNNCFDAICSYYAIIHIPREEHAAILQTIGDILKPGGLALLCLGAEDLAADYESDYFGEPMYWSHFNAETNMQLLRACGLETVWSDLVPDSHGADSSHLFVLAKKPSAGDT